MPKGNTRRKTDGYVPYARGFKVPTKSNQIKAIGYRNDSIPKEYEPSEEFFKPGWCFFKCIYNNICVYCVTSEITYN